MIVLQGISQTVFKIEDKRYTCYTNEENRIIAIIMAEGEYCDSINTNNEAIILNLSSQLDIYENSYMESITYNEELIEKLDNSIFTAIEYKTDLDKTKKKLNKITTILYISLPLNVVLLLIAL